MWRLIILATISVLWAFKVSEGFDGFENADLLEKKKNGTGCNSTHTANNSGISLNDHTLDHPCIWIIDSDHLVRLYFEQVFLDDGDSLNFYKTVEDANNRTNAFKKITTFPNGVSTLITNEKQLVLSLETEIGKKSSYKRIFEAYYSLDDCSFPVPPTVDTLYAPTYMDDVTKPIECIYHFNQIQHERAEQVFTFEEFNMSTSTVNIDGATIGGEYKGEDTDFFIDTNSKLVTITVHQKINTTDNFKLKISTVDKACSGRTEFAETQRTFTSPPDVVNNGTYVFECRWLINYKDSSKILGFQLNNADFHSVFDIAAVNNGGSKLSAPILQVTTSNKNVTQNQIVRGSSSSLWVAFKPESYKSSFSFNVTVHGQGGYYKGSGNIKMDPTTGNDTAFLLEVDKDKVVMLTFDVSTITAPATVTVYDGFDTSNLLTSIHGPIKYPIFSRSSRMMVMGTNFGVSTNHFAAAFKGVVPSCNHMSSMSAENYILSENCNSSCVWIIPPQNAPDSALVVYLQYISLKDGDNIKIHKLDDKLTQLAEINPGENHVPHLVVPSDVGILINVTQSKCEKSEDKLVLVGHSSYMPACNHDITTKVSESLQISSPLYPDTYPLFTTCKWNLTVPKESIVHMAFQTLNLAENHCLKISNGSGVPSVFQGKILPDDLFFSGNVLVEFDSVGCNKSAVSKTLTSGAGFLINATVTDCGAVMEGKKSGNFNTSVTANKSVCIWKVSVPGDNIVSYNFKKMDSLKNYELDVYDGLTVRDLKIVNNSDYEIWARTNTLIFVYKRLDVSNPSSVLAFKYDAIECKEFCENKVCMHPDWKCNGVNECGDFTDERNCAAVPIPPEVKLTGYSGTAFWLCAFAMLIIGVIVGLGIPVCYQKYKDSQYRRFQELDST